MCDNLNTTRFVKCSVMLIQCFLINNVLYGSPCNDERMHNGIVYRNSKKLLIISISIFYCKKKKHLPLPSLLKS